MRISRSRRLLVASCLAAGAALVVAPQGAVAATRSMASVAINYRFLGIPDRLAAGEYDTRFVNASRDQPHEMIGFNLGPECAGMTRAQIVDLLMAPEDEAGKICPSFEFAGAAFAPPRGRDRSTYSLTPGRSIFVCFLDTPDGVPHFLKGMLAVTDVRPLRVV